MMLAIVVNQVGVGSETFIASHIKNLLPGRTLVLSRLAATGTHAERDIVIPRSARTGRVWPVQKALGLAEFIRTGRRWALDRRQEEIVANALVANGVTAVLAEYGPNGVAVADACRRAKAALFVHFHGYDATILARNAAWRRAYRRLAPEAAGAIAPSRFLADRLIALGLPAERTHVVPCGVDPNDFTDARPQSASGQARVLAVGRLVEKKAPYLTIEAFARATADRQDVRLELVGEGPLLVRCEKAIAADGARDRITLHGAQPHATVKELMRQATIFVQHSVTAPDGDMEGLPVVIMEAMMSGLPVVATRHSGIPEAVIDGETGFLLEEGDVAGMAVAIRRLIDDPELATRFGQAGRQRALECFSLDRSIGSLRQIMGLQTAGSRPTAEKRHS